MGAVGVGHVLGDRVEATSSRQARVGGHAVRAEQHLHDARRRPRLDTLADELVGDGVVVVVDLDVVVDVHGAFLPLGHLVAVRRQGPQGGPVQPLVELPPGGAQVLHRAVVDPLEKLPDRLVHLGEAEEGPVPQGGEDPSLGDKHCGLDLGLVPSSGSPGPGRCG